MPLLPLAAFVASGWCHASDVSALAMYPRMSDATVQRACRPARWSLACAAAFVE
jgi:hypothetical protein